MQALFEKMDHWAYRLHRCLLMGSMALLPVATGCHDQTAGPGKGNVEPPPRVVNVVRIAQTGQYNEVATYYGTLQPGQTARLGFGRSGKVVLVSKTSGQRVKAGEVIAQFDIVGLENQRKQVSNALDSARNGQQPTARVADLESQLAELDARIESSTLIAPFSGALSRLSAFPGQLAATGQPLAEVVSDSTPTVEVSIAAKTARAQFPGRRLEVVMEDNRAAEALIKSIAPVVDQSTRTRKVQLEITSDLSAADYSLGSIVKVSFDSFREVTGFWLPLSAMQKRAGGLWSTMVLENRGDQTIAALRTIEVIHVENDTAYVRGALTEGDLVIADGTHRVVPGQSVIPAAGTGDLSRPIQLAPTKSLPSLPPVKGEPAP